MSLVLLQSLSREYFFDDGFDEAFGVFVAIGGAFDEDVADAGGPDFLLGDLDLGAALLLELSDGFAALADDESNALVRGGDDVGLRSLSVTLTFGLGGP